jgi:hypothetical protein
MITLGLLLVYLGGMVWGAWVSRLAFSDTATWAKASRHVRAEVMAGGAVIWPVLMLIVLAGWIAMMMQTLREEWT